MKTKKEYFIKTFNKDLHYVSKLTSDIICQLSESNNNLPDHVYEKFIKLLSMAEKLEVELEDLLNILRNHK